VKSRTTRRFREAFGVLPKPIQRRAREAYKTFLTDPYHPGLRFKRIHPSRPIYSVRIGRNYRALGIHEGDEIVWFWIGSHDEYDRGDPDRAELLPCLGLQTGRAKAFCQGERLRVVLLGIMMGKDRFSLVASLQKVRKGLSRCIGLYEVPGNLSRWSWHAFRPAMFERLGKLEVERSTTRRGQVCLDRLADHIMLQHIGRCTCFLQETCPLCLCQGSRQLDYGHSE
jgi:hypothetical protein